MSSVLEDSSPASGESLAGLESGPLAAKSGNEVYRKLLHVLPGLLPFLLVLIPHDDPLDWIAMAVVVAIAVVLTVCYLSLRSRVSRPEEANFFSTALSYPATVLGTLLVFPAHAEFAMVVVIMIGLGDGFAYICGKRFGRRNLPWNPQKSWAGLLGFLVFSAPAATLAFWLEAQNPDVPLPLAALCCGLASVAAALAESWPTQLTDNLRVGVTAAIAVSASYFLFAPLWL